MQGKEGVYRGDRSSYVGGVLLLRTSLLHLMVWGRLALFLLGKRVRTIYIYIYMQGHNRHGIWGHTGSRFRHQRDVHGLNSKTRGEEKERGRDRETQSEIRRQSEGERGSGSCKSRV